MTGDAGKADPLVVGGLLFLTATGLVFAFGLGTPPMALWRAFALDPFPIPSGSVEGFTGA